MHSRAAPDHMLAVPVSHPWDSFGARLTCTDVLHSATTVEKTWPLAHPSQSTCAHVAAQGMQCAPSWTCLIAAAVCKDTPRFIFPSYTRITCKPVRTLATLVYRVTEHRHPVRRSNAHPAPRCSHRCLVYFACARRLAGVQGRRRAASLCRPLSIHGVCRDVGWARRAPWRAPLACRTSETGRLRRGTVRSMRTGRDRILIASVSKDDHSRTTL